MCEATGYRGKVGPSVGHDPINKSFLSVACFFGSSSKILGGKRKEAINRDGGTIGKRRIRLATELQSLNIWEGSQEVQYRDPLKWIISCKNETVTGYQLLDMFYEEGATAEISDPRNIVFLFSINEKEEDIDRVVKAVQSIDAKLKETPGQKQEQKT